MSGRALVKIIVSGDTKGANKALSDTRNEADKTGSSFKTFGKVAAAGMLAVAAGVVAAGTKAVEWAEKEQNAHVKLTTAMKNSGQSWSKNAKAIEEADKAGEKFGYTTAETETVLAQLETSTGSTSKSIKLLGLAQNIAAAKGIDLASAAMAVTKASEGQLRPLKMLGIDLPVAAGGALKAKVAYEKLLKAGADLKTVNDKIHAGLLKGPAAYKALKDAQDKVAAAQAKANDTANAGSNIIDALSKKMGGQATAAAGTFSGQVKALKAEAEDFGAKIGMKLIPILTDFATGINTTVIPAIQNMVRWVQENWPRLQAAIMPTIARIQGYIEGFVATAEHLWAQFGGRIIQFATEAWGSVKTEIKGAIEFISGLFRLIADLLTGKWGKLWGDIAAIFGGAWKMIKGAIGLAWDQLSSTLSLAWDGIKNATKGAIGKVVDFFIGLPGRILSALAALPGEMLAIGKALVDGIIKGVGDLGSALWDHMKGGLGGLVGKVKSFFGIASPSRVFYEIGTNVMKGFTLGIGDQTGKAVAATKKTMQAVVAAIKGSQSAVRNAMAAIVSGKLSVQGGKLDVQDAVRNLAMAKNDAPLSQFAVKDAQAQLDADRAAGADAETLAKDEIALNDARLNASAGTEAVQRAEIDLANARLTEKQNVKDLATAHHKLSDSLQAMKDLFAYLVKIGILTPGKTKKFHSGGVFNSGMGEGLAILKDGETVLTPSQMRSHASSSGGGGTQIINLHGTITPTSITVLQKRWQRRNGITA